MTYYIVQCNYNEINEHGFYSAKYKESLEKYTLVVAVFKVTTKQNPQWN